MHVSGKHESNVTLHPMAGDGCGARNRDNLYRSAEAI